MTSVAQPDTQPASRSALVDSHPSDSFMSQITHEFARRHLVLSAGTQDGVEQLRLSDRTPPIIPFNVGVRLGRPFETHVESSEVIARAIDRAYLQDAQQDRHQSDAPEVVVSGSSDIDQDLEDAVQEAERDVLTTAGKAPAVRLVDLILFEALSQGASDVHVQPLRTETLIRFRLDGTLHTVRSLPAALASSVISRIKIMAQLDIAERRAPQDGRCTVTVGGGSQAGRSVDLRISTLPSTYGERVVLRLLDTARSAHLSSFEALGMPEAVKQAYLAQVRKTNGIVLSTGPTGSGKTTTLYATLAWVSATHAGGTKTGCELNMMTIEDPVEYDLSEAGLAVSQTQVNTKKAVTFSAGLRHILRQDPDVIMVGEIRDEDTARIAVQASLTGHLVLSTLHTNDAASAVSRLLDLGVEPFLVSSSLTAVLAQRLLRRRHATCAGQGCGDCLETGFKGRTGVFELLVVSAEIRELIGRRASSVEIKDVARREGMETLLEAGTTIVESGGTTARELARVIDSVERVES